MAIARYKNQEDVKNNYSTCSIANYFYFENRLYEYIGKERVAGRVVLTYRCREERHNVKIHVRYGHILDVRAFYQIYHN